VKAYEIIDKELYAWAASHGLQIFNEYDDIEVRSTDVMGDASAKCQIWVEPAGNNTFVVNIWNYKKKQAKRVKQLRASKADISDKLEEAYQTALEWLSD
jgi:hypothetical protein